jgi:UBX domain-containing protein 1/4
MSLVRVGDMVDFKQQLASAGTRLVVVDFWATWCGPCTAIAPVFESLAAQYAGRGLFLKVDVDEAADVAQFCSVSAMPTFHGYLAGQLVFNFSGADRARLEAEVARHAPTSAGVSFAGQGQALGGPKVDWGASSSEDAREAAAAAAAKRFGGMEPAAAKGDVPLDEVAKARAAKSAKAAARLVEAAEAEEGGDVVKVGETAGDEESVTVDSAMISALEEMGFPKVRAIKGLIATKSVSTEAAMEWVFEHSDDADIDDDADGIVAAVTSAVAASTEKPKSNLSSEERAKKAEDLMLKARAKRAAEEKQAAIDREKERVRSGKEMLLTKQEIEAKQRKLVYEERRREKQAQIEERRKIRENIASDKAARHVKFNMAGIAAPPAPEPAPAPSVAPTAAPTAGMIQFRLPDGGRLTSPFGPDDTLGNAAGFVAKERPDLAASGFVLQSSYPKRVFGEGDMFSTLAELHLLPRGALIVTLR